MPGMLEILMALRMPGRLGDSLDSRDTEDPGNAMDTGDACEAVDTGHD